MAVRETRSRLRRALDAVVSSPPRATVTVGASILTLILIIEALAARWPSVRYVRYFVPFLPPFVITRAARRIAERRSAHEFIRDARPYVFVAFPDAPTEAGLLAARPLVMSDSSPEHLGIPLDELFDAEPMPARAFVDPRDRERVVAELVGTFAREGRGCVGSRLVWLRRGEVEMPYLATTVLSRFGDQLKWQGTLVEVPAALLRPSAARELDIRASPGA